MGKGKAKKSVDADAKGKLDNKTYDRDLKRLHGELVAMQDSQPLRRYAAA